MSGGGYEQFIDIPSRRRNVASNNGRSGSVRFVTDSGQWPELIDIENQPIERMRESMVSGWWGDMARAVADATETPLEMAVMVAMGAMATASQRKFEVEIETDFRQPLNLYVCIVMDVANRKSGVVRPLFAPIETFEDEQRSKQLIAVRKAEAEHDLWRQKIENLKRQAARSDNGEHSENLIREMEMHLASEPVCEHLPQLLADDATPESVASLLFQNDERLTIASAEPEVFDMMLGRYSKAPNLGIWLKGHDGDRHVENRRQSGREPLILSNPLLTLCVMCQPQAIHDAGQQKIMRGRGLLGRFLFVAPPSPVGYRDCRSRPIPARVSHSYVEAVRRLLMTEIPRDERGRLRPRRIAMSDEAHALWKSQQLRIERNLRPGESLDCVKDWAGKFPAALARIAANIHVAEVDSPASVPISGATMNTAIDLGRVIESQSLAVFGALNANPLRPTAMKIIERIRRDGLTEISRRDAMRMDRTIQEVKVITPVMEMLEDHGYLVAQADGDRKPGRPSQRYRMNPAVHECDRTDKTDSVLSVTHLR